MEYTNEAFILKILNINEHDGYIFALLDNGIKIKLFAPGINKENSKNGANLKEGTFVTLEYFPNSSMEKGRLKSAKNILYINSMTLPQVNLINFLCAFLIDFNNLNIMIYRILKKIWYTLNVDSSYITILYVLFIELLRILKIDINISSCAICYTRQDIYEFNLREGGLLCYRHRTNKKGLDVLFLKKIIRLFSEIDINNSNTINFNFVENEILSNLFIDYFKNILGYNTFSFKNI